MLQIVSGNSFWVSRTPQYTPGLDCFFGPPPSRTIAAKDGPQPTSALSAGHARPACHPSSPDAAANWSATSSRSSSAAPTAATGARRRRTRRWLRAACASRRILRMALSSWTGIPRWTTFKARPPRWESIWPGAHQILREPGKSPGSVLLRRRRLRSEQFIDYFGEKASAVSNQRNWSRRCWRAKSTCRLSPAPFVQFPRSGPTVLISSSRFRSMASRRSMTCAMRPLRTNGF